MSRLIFSAEKDVRPTPYGWVEVQKLPAQYALKNADQYAYFGLIAKLADRFFRLAEPDALAMQGRVIYDRSIPP